MVVAGTPRAEKGSDRLPYLLGACWDAAFLTGRYAFRTWSDWRSEDFGKPSYLAKLGLKLAYNKRGEPTRRIHALDTEERTIAEALRDAGYFTSLLGKWHLGMPTQQRPNKIYRRIIFCNCSALLTVTG